MDMLFTIKMSDSLLISEKPHVENELKTAS